MMTPDARPFLPAPDGVDPRSVPPRVLWTGATMPAIGLGTFGSDHATGAEVAAAVRGALEVGYRHIDCAAVYGNEWLIGDVLAAANQHHDHQPEPRHLDGRPLPGRGRWRHDVNQPQRHAVDEGHLRRGESPLWHRRHDRFTCG